MEDTRRPLVVFDETSEPLVYRSPAAAAGDIEAIDVEEGVYGGFAYAADGELLRIETLRGAVIFAPTGETDWPALRRRLSTWHPELADADERAIRAFIDQDLAQQRARQESRWYRRLMRRFGR